MSKAFTTEGTEDSEKTRYCSQVRSRLSQSFLLFKVINFSVFSVVKILQFVFALVPTSQLNVS
jgi:hypothetical protein